MWQERKAFELTSSEVRSHDSPLTFQLDYIIDFRFIGGIPVTAADDGADGTTGAPGETTEQYLEVFMVLSNNGLVVASSLNDVKLHSRCPHAVPPSATMLVHRHDESAEDGAFAIAVHEGMVASCGEKTIRLSHFFPICGEEIVTIRLPQTVATRSLLLWEGASSWMSLPGEEAALYLFSGSDDGVVRLWRLDVLEHTYEPLMCFATTYPDTDQSTKIHRQLRVPIHCLMLDGESDNCTAPSRLLAGSDNRWSCWSLDLETLAPNRRHTADSIHHSKWLNSTVFARGSFFVQATIESKQHCGDHEGVDHPDALEVSKWKPKHATVLDGCELGTVVNEAEETQGEGGDGGTSVLLRVQFESLKNTLKWPAECVSRATTTTLLANAHQGAVYTMRSLRPGRFVTGGQDGVVKVWDWIPSAEKYLVAFQAQAHTDLLKRVVPLRHPDIFLTAGYDGTMKEWHLVDLPEEKMFCRATLAPTIRDGTTSSSYSQNEAASCSGTELEGSRLGIGAIDVFQSAHHVVFLSNVFEGTIRSYILVAVDTCELPPGWYFDGVRSRRGKDEGEWIDGDLEIA